MKRGEYIRKMALGWVLIVAPFILNFLMLLDDLSKGAMICTSPLFVVVSDSLTHPFWLTIIAAGIVVLIIAHRGKKRGKEEEA